MPPALNHFVLVLPHHHDRKLFSEIPYMKKRDTDLRYKISICIDFTEFLVFEGMTVYKVLNYINPFKGLNRNKFLNT